MAEGQRIEQCATASVGYDDLGGGEAAQELVARHERRSVQRVWQDGSSVLDPDFRVGMTARILGQRLDQPVERL
jgi:hypothetical protein